MRCPTWITGSFAVASPHQNQTSPSNVKQLLIVIAGVLGFLLVGNLLTWRGPDPGHVVRASAPEVADFSSLSKEKVISKLRAVALNKHPRSPTSHIELSNDGNLLLKLESTQSNFQSTRTIPLAQLDQFLYAEQTVKGDRNWSIHIYCANYQKCITGSNSRTAGNFSLNADGILYMSPNGDVYQALGLLNRLLELHGAQSTIDVRKNTIRISEEHWRRSAKD